jgi:hypothetical protein
MKPDGTMTSIKWSDYITDIHAMHIEHGIALNTAEKAGATDLAMSELI